MSGSPPLEILDFSSNDQCQVCGRWNRDNPDVVAVLDRDRAGDGLCICADGWHTVGHTRISHLIVQGLFLCGRPRYGEAPEDVRSLTAPSRCAVCATSSLEDVRWSSYRYAARLPNETTGGHPRTFGSFMPLEGNRTALESAQAFVNQATPQILVLIGQTGCGKSHLLEAVGRQCCQNQILVLYETAASMADAFRSCNDPASDWTTERLKAFYQTFDVLIIDELKENTTPFAADRLLEVFDERLQTGRRLVIASNMTKAEVAGSFGERLADRLWAVHDKSLQTVPMTNGSYRAKAQDYRQRGKLHG